MTRQIKMEESLISVFMPPQMELITLAISRNSNDYNHRPLVTARHAICCSFFVSKVLSEILTEVLHSSGMLLSKDRPIYLQHYTASQIYLIGQRHSSGG
jgi:hypothetical protein